MRLQLSLLSLAVLAIARPQDPTPVPPPDDAPPPNPPPPASTTAVPDAPPPSGTAQPEGAFCECGYTYCANVLMGMQIPWTEDQLAQAYCNTPEATCNDKTPSTKVASALYICLCGGIDQKVGDHLELVRGCDECLNVGPDFRGRCKTPCSAGGCDKGTGDTDGDKDDSDDMGKREAHGDLTSENSSHRLFRMWNNPRGNVHPN